MGIGTALVLVAWLVSIGMLVYEARSLRRQRLEYERFTAWFDKWVDEARKDGSND